jgi:hypothetical protein
MSHFAIIGMNCQAQCRDAINRACFYGSLNKIDRNDITISFVTTRYPRNLMEYLIDNQQDYSGDRAA